MVYKTMPTGGVKRPTIELRVMINPKWTDRYRVGLCRHEDWNRKQDHGDSFHETAENEQNDIDDQQDHPGIAGSVTGARE